MRARAHARRIMHERAAAATASAALARVCVRATLECGRGTVRGFEVSGDAGVARFRTAKPARNASLCPSKLSQETYHREQSAHASRRRRFRNRGPIFRKYIGARSQPGLPASATDPLRAPRVADWRTCTAEAIAHGNRLRVAAYSVSTRLSGTAAQGCALHCTARIAAAAYAGARPGWPSAGTHQRA